MSRLGIIDTHAHLDDNRFDSDRAAVMERLANDMEAVITQGTTYESSVASVNMAEQYDFVYAAVGWHPEDLAGIKDESYIAELERLAREHTKVVAIGEIGLDYYWKENEPKEVQLLRLKQQCDLAYSLDLPVVIHNREAHGDCLNFFQNEVPKELKVVFHCYSGSLEMAKELWKRGYYLGFGGTSTYKNNKKVREVLAACPEDLFVLETDCPYLAPEPFRGRRNDPSLTEYVAKNAALVRGTSFEHIAVSALKAIKDRRSIRKFKSEPISEMDLHTILEAGIAAPSSKNRQPWHFTVIRGEAKEELTRVMERGLNLEVKAHEPFLPDSMKFINGAFTSVNVMREAPVVVLVSNERGKGIDFTDNLSVDERVAEICNVQSVAAAIENMLLAAQELGIGSLWICDVFFAYPEISAWLEKKNPGHGMLVAALAFGYGEEAPRARTRKTLHDVATFIK